MYRRVLSAVVLVSILATSATEEVNLEECRDGDGDIGLCVPLITCRLSLTRLQQKDATYVLASACGFDGNVPKVCCPTNPMVVKTSTEIPGSPKLENTTQTAVTKTVYDLFPNTNLAAQSTHLVTQPAEESSQVSNTPTQPINAQGQQAYIPTQPSDNPVVYPTAEVAIEAAQPNEIYSDNDKDMLHHHTGPASSVRPVPHRRTTQVNTSQFPKATSNRTSNPGQSSPNTVHTQAPASTRRPTIVSGAQGEQLPFNDTELIPESQYAEGLLPSRDECGLIHDQTDKIFGGSLLAIDEYPWLVRLKYRFADVPTRKSSGTQERYACGGSLISKRYVLTAAHCVRTRHTLINVRLGEWDDESQIDCQGNICSAPPLDIEIESIKEHERFDLQIGYTHDIALLRLSTSVEFTDWVRPVCLPNSAVTMKPGGDMDDVYYAAGWGRTEYGSNSAVKRKVRLSNVPFQTCKLFYKESLGNASAPVICAGGRSGEDTCAGDSGGPLVETMVENHNSNWFLVGIVSAGGAVCGQVGRPGLYTRVSHYLKWITDNMKP